MPRLPVELKDNRKMGEDENGTLFIGTKGIIMCGGWGNSPRLIPETKMHAYKRPPKLCSVHYQKWISACKDGAPAGCNFEYAGPLTETVLLEIIAIRTGKKLVWDPINLKITNDEAANRLVREEDEGRL